MNAVVDPALQGLHYLDSAIAAACDRIAPAWPLDQAIAVNPWWGWRGLPIERADAILGAVAGATLRMPLAWYRQQWRDGAFTRPDLEAVTTDHRGADALQRVLEGQGERERSAAVPLVTELADARRDLGRALSWSHFVLQHVSQQCAAYFDRHQAAWHPGAGEGLYASWHAFARADRSPSALLGAPDVAQRLRALPASSDEAIAVSLERLGWQADAAGLAAYLTALLSSVQGWASWASWQRWQAQLRGDAPRDAGAMRELLAIRLAWEAVLAPMASIPADWQLRWRTAAIARPSLTAAVDWQLLAALEHAFQRPLAGKLAAASHAAASATKPAAPEVLAFFCIDVRSEPMRRALEAAGRERVQTGGFAGFFGLPVAHTPVGSRTGRPQLPGLLAPGRATEDSGDDASLADALRARRRRQGAWRSVWNQLTSGPSSTFSYVEALGGLAAGKLLTRSLAAATPDRGACELRPRLLARPGASAQEELQERRDLAAGILRAMGLARPDLHWPALVLLAGHGSRSANNPFAATLECGACGGQTGEVNARVLAGLLNDGELRVALTAAGIHIPASTRFVAGVHWTTTDDVALYDTETLPASSVPVLDRLREWLAGAGRQVRAERAPALGLPAQAPGQSLLRALQRRANDWSQVRPEWGLAGNAGFIVAPRARTRGLDLHGRCFLHDYDWRVDPDWKVLELVMTAPMVVTNWINLQYLGSVVDPRRWGSGNKTLHNVVGGRIGVFEGNGGDLRVGLPLQSVHDGQRFVHTPLRLSVFIEAPREAIDAIIARHAVVRELADNGWLHLHCLVPDAGVVLQRQQGEWQVLAEAAAAARTEEHLHA